MRTTALHNVNDLFNVKQGDDFDMIWRRVVINRPIRECLIILERKTRETVVLNLVLAWFQPPETGSEGMSRKLSGLVQTQGLTCLQSFNQPNPFSPRAPQPTVQADDHNVTRGVKKLSTVLSYVL